MSNRPKLRFREFNDSIVECRIENVLKIKHGKDQKAIECKDGIYPILATSGEIGRTNTYLWNKPCVLIGRKGTINKPQYMDTPFWTVDTLFYSDVNSSNNAKYLYYLFNTINWKRYDESTGVPSLSAKTVERIKVIITNNKDEQKKIAEFLSKVDEVIAEREEEVKDLKKQKKGLMQKIFSQQIRFTDSNNNPYPEWQETHLKDIFIEYKEKSTVQDEYPVLTSSRQGIMLQSDYYSGENRITERDNVGFNILPCNYITYRSRSDDGFFTFNMNTLNHKGLISTYYPVFDTTCNNYFIVLCLNYNKNVFFKYSVGSSQKVLSYNELENISLKLPCLEEQQKIANILSKLDELIEEKKALLSDWQQFKKGLLQQMFV